MPYVLAGDLSPVLVSLVSMLMLVLLMVFGSVLYGSPATIDTKE